MSSKASKGQDSAPLRLLDSARDDLGDIAKYVLRKSGSRRTAEAFAGELVAHCEKIAKTEPTMGRARPELLPDIRSVVFKSYIIFFRYLPSSQSRDVLEVVNILEGHRDIEAHFSKRRDP